MGMTEWVLVTLLTPEAHGAWIAGLRQFLVDRETVFVSLGASSLIVRRAVFAAAMREAGRPRQSETLYRIRPFDGEVMDALLGEMPMAQVVEDVADPWRG